MPPSSVSSRPLHDCRVAMCDSCCGSFSSAASTAMMGLWPKQTTGGEYMQNDHLPLVTIELDNGATIQAELYPEVAPNTVNSFISLVGRGFYDGLTFHRVIPAS